MTREWLQFLICIIFIGFAKIAAAAFAGLGFDPEELHPNALAKDDECLYLAEGEDEEDQSRCALNALQRQHGQRYGTKDPDWSSFGAWQLSALAPVVSKSHPGARAWVSQLTLDYFSDKILPTFISRLEGLRFKDASGKKSGVSYDAHNIAISSPQIRRSDLSFVENLGIRLCIDGFTAKVTMDWKLRWYFFRSSGGANAMVKTERNACGLVVLGTSPTGHPTAKLTALEVGLKLSEIKFSGTSLSWIYDVLAWVFRSRVEKQAEEAVRTGIQDGFAKDFAPKLEKLNLALKIPVDANTTFAIDLSMLDVAVYKNYLMANIRGEFSQPSHPEFVYPIKPKELQFHRPKNADTSMLTIRVTDWLLESGAWLLHQNGLLKITVHADEVPPNILDLKLNTHSLSFLAPGLKTAYPSALNMTLTAAVASPPKIDFSEKEISLKVPFNFSFDVIKPNGEKALAFMLHSIVTGKAHVWVERGTPQRIRSNVTILSHSPASQGSSFVGPVNLIFADQLLEVFKSVSQDALNDKTLADGIPLISSRGFSLADTKIDVATTMDIFSEIRYDPSFEFHGSSW
eukprot:TRINITY_DN16568_c0_g1_i2.p1 TRINITY_DN16568_c0_g1~~TRINITY_DN16568_c0_g1_i2.p1  ORF type:complete len:572 (+),score=84.46 TRINITY_DN16568_c0_g1_i2:64-1779(+)